MHMHSSVAVIKLRPLVVTMRRPNPERVYGLAVIRGSRILVRLRDDKALFVVLLYQRHNLVYTPFGLVVQVELLEQLGDPYPRSAKFQEVGLDRSADKTGEGGLEVMGVAAPRHLPQVVLAVLLKLINSRSLK